jgi:hypothetical protein
MRPRGAFAAFAAIAFVVMPGCRPEPPGPIDPSEPTPAVDCDGGVPLAFTRTAADTRFDAAPWVEACSLCPADAFDVAFSLDDAVVEGVTAWARGTGCVVAMAADPLPETSVDVTYRIESGDLSGEVTLELPPVGERGENPPDLDGMTFALDWELASGRHPIRGFSRLVDPAPGPALLVAFGSADAAGVRPVTVGATDASGEVQDPCVPTASWGLGSVSNRQVAASLDEDAPVLQPTPIPVRAGAFQGRLNETGTGLFDIALLGVVDSALLEPLLGPTEDFCSFLSVDGSSACGPCTPPVAGVGEDPRTCFTAVWEWAAAARTDTPLQPVDADALPPECTREN